jgi:chromosome partitioning protein
MKVIAVANTKGGVAKTTTCLSLGGSLAEQGNLVLLVDLDSQAHLTSSLGVKPDGLRRSVSDVLLNQDSLASISVETQVFGLDLAPANDELVIIDKMLYRHPGYEYRLKTDIENGRRWLYDVVIIDCPPTFGTVTINALTAADLLVIPLQCEHYAVQSLIRMLEMVRLTRRKTNAGLRYRLLVTMFDMRNKVHPMILKYLRDHFEEAVFENMIQVDTKLRESPAHARPITHYAPKTRAARQYRALARELMACFGPKRKGRGSQGAEEQRGGGAEEQDLGLSPRSAAAQGTPVEERPSREGPQPSVKPMSKVLVGDNRR